MILPCLVLITVVSLKESLIDYERSDEEVSLFESHLQFQQKLRTWFPLLSESTVYELSKFLSDKDLNSSSIHNLLAEQSHFVGKFQTYYIEFASKEENLALIHKEVERLIQEILWREYDFVPLTIYDFFDPKIFGDINLMLDNKKLEEKMKIFLVCFEDFRKKTELTFWQEVKSFFKAPEDGEEEAFSCPTLTAN